MKFLWCPAQDDRCRAMRVIRPCDYSSHDALGPGSPDKLLERSLAALESAFGPFVGLENEAWPGIGVTIGGAFGGSGWSHKLAVLS